MRTMKLQLPANLDGNDVLLLIGLVLALILALAGGLVR